MRLSSGILDVGLKNLFFINWRASSAFWCFKEILFKNRICRMAATTSKRPPVRHTSMPAPSAIGDKTAKMGINAG